MSKQTKLYEILAVEPDTKKEAAEAAKEAISRFSQPPKFVGMETSVHPVLEGEPELPVEVTKMAFTVQEELMKLRDVFGRYINVAMIKEATNTQAKADVIVDNAEFLLNMPATALLNLEARLEELAKVYEAIPTLDLTESWNYDQGRACYVSDRRVSYRTKKVMRNHVLSDATEHHPAQVQVYNEEIPTYRIERVISSSILTPVQKQLKLDRINKLAKAVKQARQRANDTEIAAIEVADKVFDYIETGAL